MGQQIHGRDVNRYPELDQVEMLLRNGVSFLGNQVVRRLRVLHYSKLLGGHCVWLFPCLIPMRFSLIPDLQCYSFDAS